MLSAHVVWADDLRQRTPLRALHALLLLAYGICGAPCKERVRERWEIACVLACQAPGDAAGPGASAVAGGDPLAALLASLPQPLGAPGRPAIYDGPADLMKTLAFLACAPPDEEAAICEVLLGLGALVPLVRLLTRGAATVHATATKRRQDSAHDHQKRERARQTASRGAGIPGALLGASRPSSSASRTSRPHNMQDSPVEVAAAVAFARGGGAGCDAGAGRRGERGAHAAAKRRVLSALFQDVEPTQPRRRGRSQRAGVRPALPSAPLARWGQDKGAGQAAAARDAVRAMGALARASVRFVSARILWCVAGSDVASACLTVPDVLAWCALALEHSLREAVQLASLRAGGGEPVLPGVPPSEVPPLQLAEVEIARLSGLNTTLLPMPEGAVAAWASGGFGRGVSLLAASLQDAAAVVVTAGDRLRGGDAGARAAEGSLELYRTLTGTGAIPSLVANLLRVGTCAAPHLGVHTCRNRRLRWGGGTYPPPAATATQEPETPTEYRPPARASAGVAPEAPRRAPQRPSSRAALVAEMMDSVADVGRPPTREEKAARLGQVREDPRAWADSPPDSTPARLVTAPTLRGSFCGRRSPIGCAEFGNGTPRCTCALGAAVAALAAALPLGLEADKKLSPPPPELTPEEEAALAYDRTDPQLRSQQAPPAMSERARAWPVGSATAPVASQHSILTHTHTPFPLHSHSLPWSSGAHLAVVEAVGIPLLVFAQRASALSDMTLLGLTAICLRRMLQSVAAQRCDPPPPYWRPAHGSRR